MNLFSLLIFFIFIFTFSLIATRLVRQYSVRKSLIDIPNERSSHSLPTPRGGGLSITLSILISTVWLHYSQLISFNTAMALFGGGSLVAIVGWLDDHRDLAIVWRAMSYTIAAVWAVYCLGGLNTITLGQYLIALDSIGILIIVLGLVWVTNLYNFMDGTDAFAAIQAICTGVMSGILFLSSGVQGLAILCFVIALATSGFLYWNWPPAKIFMGDVGSCLIGFSFGLLALLGEKNGTLPILVWFILLALFICDATFTLFMRIMKKEKWYSAHRSHAYQRLVQMGISHARLAIYLLLINVTILWPMAYFAYHWKNISLLILAAIILLMGILWISIQLRYKQVCLAGN